MLILTGVCQYRCLAHGREGMQPQLIGPGHVSKHADFRWCAGCAAWLTIVAVCGNGDGLTSLLAVQYIIPLMQLMAMEKVLRICWL